MVAQLLRFLEKLKHGCKPTRITVRMSLNTFFFESLSQILLNTVVTILIANVDNIPAVSWKQLYENVGIDSISYSPPAANISVTHWPTLGGISDSNMFLLCLP